MQFTFWLTSVCQTHCKFDGWKVQFEVKAFIRFHFKHRAINMKNRWNHSSSRKAEFNSISTRIAVVTKARGRRFFNKWWIYANQTSLWQMRMLVFDSFVCLSILFCRPWTWNWNWNHSFSFAFVYSSVSSKLASCRWVLVCVGAPIVRASKQSSSKLDQPDSRRTWKKILSSHSFFTYTRPWIQPFVSRFCLEQILQF